MIAMRCLERNKRNIYYALYTGKTEATDSNGYKTGEHQLTYGDPVLLRANVSPAKGTARLDVFGEGVEYTKVLCVEDPECPVDEYSILWIGISPTNNEHNYIVLRVARSINNVLYAVKEVNISGVSQNTSESTESTEPTEGQNGTGDDSQTVQETG